MDSVEYLKSVINDEDRKILGIDRYSEKQAEVLTRIILYHYSLGATKNDNIDEIKYDGRLIILDDGSRWEVDSIDSDTADLWLPGDRVVIIDDEMYKLDETEKVSVTEE